MTSAEVAAGIIEAMESDQHEVPLGAAAGLHDQRDALFSAINE